MAELTRPLRLLRALKAAGPDGMTTPDLAVAAGENLGLGRQRILTWLGDDLRRMVARGEVERAGWAIASSFNYHNNYSVVWRITPAGLARLELPPPGPSKRERAEQRRRELEADLARRKRMLAESSCRYDSKTDPALRAVVMKELRAGGLLLGEIGAVFGVTRERVRQILKGDHP